MDITKSADKIYTTKSFNNETIAYGASFTVCTFIFLILKQFLKLVFSITAPVAVLISFIVFEVALFIFEKKFVFKDYGRSKKFIEVGFYLFRCFVDFSFFKIFDFLFFDCFKLEKALVYLCSFIVILVFNFNFDKLIVFISDYKHSETSPSKLYGVFFKNRFVLLSVAISFVGIMFVFGIFKLFPFGNFTVMRMDLYHQYGPLFAELYERVINHQSFIYSWNSGGGSSFLGNYFNYLSSPLSALIFFFDRKQIAFAITTLVIVKGVLSAGTFTFYIKESFKSSSYASAALGVFYAFSGYFLAYYWNIMWIDGVILLPLIVLGIERLIKEGKSALYIAALSVMLFSNYYMGYMSCIFSVIYFFVYYFLNFGAGELVDKTAEIKNRYSIKELLNNLFVNRCVRFAISSLICGCLCAAMLIPLYFILQSCSATSDTFPSTMSSYFNLIKLVTSHFAALETTIRSSGDDVLPNIYCGVLTAILIPLYYINKDIRLKEKTIYTLMIILFIFSFNNNCANFIWHAFHFPNDLPFRFSYMYCFIALIMGYRALSKFKGIRYQDIAIVGMVWVLIVLLVQENPTNKISSITIYVTLAFIIVWTAVLMLIHKGKIDKFVIGITIISVAFCEVIVGDCHSYLFTQKQDDYVSNYDSYTEAIDYLNKNDKDFYRMELCDLDTLMDPSLYGYRGMSIFSSMAYEDFSQEQFSLGMGGNRINSYSYNTQTPVYNMMFGIKYLLYKDNDIAPSADFYTEVHKTKDKKVRIFKNDYYLPLAFAASSDLFNLEIEESDPFEMQSSFIYNATGISDIFVPVEYIETSSDSIECEEVNENGTAFFSKTDTTSDTDTVDVTFKATTDSNVYAYVTSPDVDNINFYWNSYADSTNQNIDEPYIIDLGKHKKGDKITVSIDCGSSESDDSSFEIYAYSVNKSALDSAYELLKLGALDISDYSDTCINGKIEAGYDGYMFVSVPFDKGWKFYVDGEKTDSFEISDSMTAIALKHGEHNIKMKYAPKGLYLGIGISLTTVLLLALYGILKRFSKADK